MTDSKTTVLGALASAIARIASEQNDAEVRLVADSLPMRLSPASRMAIARDVVRVANTTPWSLGEVVATALIMIDNRVIPNERELVQTSNAACASNISIATQARREMDGEQA